MHFFDINDRQSGTYHPSEIQISRYFEKWHLEDVEIERGIFHRSVFVNALSARALQQKGGADPLVLLAIEDITPQNGWKNTPLHF